MKIEKTELKRFEVPNDTVTLFIVVDSSKPYYFVEFNGEKIATRDDNFNKTVRIFENVRKVLRLQNDILHCEWCAEYIVGTKEYQLSEDYKQTLCPKCHAQALGEYKTVTEVSTE